ncbi:RluA family pseudouridine synthase [Tannockella kyphosi]|uniref:RluA family pseudouridine synthase n=1 Tax=Tannockella kyphosi TaxID=2899121 RepID=UPI002012EA90|nr:RluA family pseudouridine synthase [Tannockella kyphosi]
MKYNVKQEMLLLDFLMIHMSRKQAKLYLKYKQVYCNQMANITHDYVVKPGDVVEIKKEQASPLDILYEDNDCVIINKPSGLLSMSGGGEKEKTAYHLVSTYLKTKDKNARNFIVHRLDRDTSGILLFAKNEKMKNLLQNDWNNLVIQRGYIAIVEGKLKQDKGTIKNYLDESKTQQVYITKKGGKLAVTHYRVLKTNNKQSMVEVYLDTGRKNQIRVHMQSLGNSIVGDKKYGANTNPIQRLGLHCHDFLFTHPITKKKIHIQCDSPKNFTDLFK